ncbi:MAG: DUF4160 domain-containing protein [Bacilli bacterium]|nr:DUF4160 domain-containing protein [Bacilli bacterium]MBO4682946.1 DUF4160 domain-containing protein [Bacilli bacterium]
MPTLSRFYGIIIRMYFLPKEHNPPHIHVIYGDGNYSITIKDMVILEGEQNPPARVLSMVKEWMALHQEELLEMWETQELHPIEPLK